MVGVCARASVENIDITPHYGQSAHELSLLQWKKSNSGKNGLRNASSGADGTMGLRPKSGIGSNPAPSGIDQKGFMDMFQRTSLGSNDPRSHERKGYRLSLLLGTRSHSGGDRSGHKISSNRQAMGPYKEWRSKTIRNQCGIKQESRVDMRCRASLGGCCGEQNACWE